MNNNTILKPNINYYVLLGSIITVFFINNYISKRLICYLQFQYCIGKFYIYILGVILQGYSKLLYHTIIISYTLFDYSFRPFWGYVIKIMRKLQDIIICIHITFRYRGNENIDAVNYNYLQRTIFWSK